MGKEQAVAGGIPAPSTLCPCSRFPQLLISRPAQLTKPQSTSLRFPTSANRPASGNNFLLFPAPPYQTHRSVNQAGQAMWAAQGSWGSVPFWRGQLQRGGGGAKQVQPPEHLLGVGMC